MQPCSETRDLADDEQRRRLDVAVLRELIERAEFDQRDALAPGPAPDFTLPARDGGSVQLSSLKGQVVMINVWATWCGPCRQEMPLLGWGFLQRSTVNVFYDRIRCDYDDFRNVLAGGSPGTEPLYGFDADVLRVFVSAWF